MDYCTKYVCTAKMILASCYSIVNSLPLFGFEKNLVLSISLYSKLVLRI